MLCFHLLIGLSHPLRHQKPTIYLGRTDEVVLGKSSATVSAKVHFTGVEANLQAGMMVFLMRDLGDLIDNGHRLPELFETKPAFEASRFCGISFPRLL